MDHTYTHTEIHNDDGIDVNYIVERLNYALDQEIPEDLFTRNILIRSNNEDSYNVSFYYSKIRDYIICFQIHKLDKKVMTSLMISSPISIKTTLAKALLTFMLTMPAKPIKVRWLNLRKTNAFLTLPHIILIWMKTFRPSKRSSPLHIRRNRYYSAGRPS